jgi:hypothetical protein
MTLHWTVLPFLLFFMAVIFQVVVRSQMKEPPWWVPHFYRPYLEWQINDPLGRRVHGVLDWIVIICSSAVSILLALRFLGIF